MLLDVDGGEVAEHKGAGEFFLRVVVFASEDYNGIGGADTLVSASGVAHYGNHGSRHSGVASAGGAGKDVGEDGFAHYAFAERSGECLSEAMSVVSLEGALRCRHVESSRLVDEIDFFKRSGCGVFEDCA